MDGLNSYRATAKFVMPLTEHDRKIHIMVVVVIKDSVFFHIFRLLPPCIV